MNKEQAISAIFDFLPRHSALDRMDDLAGRTFASFGLDDLDVVELVLELEAAHDVEIPEPEFSAVASDTFGGLAALLMAKTS